MLHGGLVTLPLAALLWRLGQGRAGAVELDAGEGAPCSPAGRRVGLFGLARR